MGSSLFAINADPLMEHILLNLQDIGGLRMAIIGMMMVGMGLFVLWKVYENESKNK